MDEKAYITVNGKQLFDVQLHWQPVAPDPKACELCNEALRKARERVDIVFDVQPGGFVPTGPVVESSVETAIQPDDKTTE